MDKMRRKCRSLPHALNSQLIKINMEICMTRWYLYMPDLCMGLHLESLPSPITTEENKFSGQFTNQTPNNSK